MPDFMIRFLICNIFISIVIGILLAARGLFQKYLSARMRYHLWFFLSGLLAVPFCPFRSAGPGRLFSMLKNLNGFSVSGMDAGINKTANITGTGNLIYDFALSVNRKTPSAAGSILFCIWIAGMFFMLMFLTRSALRLHRLKRAALPLQNVRVRRLYQCCLKEAGIVKNIPVYSSAFLKSPVITGLWKPSVYLPVSFVSECPSVNLRYMLLHELQHYRHKDIPAGFLMNMIHVVYWFNPFVLYALKEMRTDREIACDASVLGILDETERAGYGHTLIDLAEKISLSPFPFAAGIGESRKQIHRRIRSIASYRKPARRDIRKGIAAFVLICAVLSCFVPILSARAADTGTYRWNPARRQVVLMDLSAYFGDYEGSFVLYDPEKDIWNIYDMEHAVRRVSPDSTYKIYDALFALEEGVITPSRSLILWDGKTYPFASWNADQTLSSALTFSVNWYFQALDAQLGRSAIDRYIQNTGYGNQDTSGSLSSYWMESSLKISPVEQVELLTKLYTNRFDFAQEHIDSVTDAIRLSSSGAGTLYGKTGTGDVNGKNRNGWFVGYVETADNTCFFAVNITAADHADGTAASEIALSVLSDLGIFQTEEILY